MRLLRRRSNGNGGQEEPALQHLLVSLTSTPEATQLLGFACQLAQAFKARLTVVYALEVPRSLALETPNLPGEEEGRRVLQMAERMIREGGCGQGETLLIPAHHAGYAIVQKALQLKVDAILISAHQQRQIELGVFNSTTEIVMKKAPCLVWVYQSPRGGTKK